MPKTIAPKKRSGKLGVKAIAAALGCAVCAIAISLTGVLQESEWALLDLYFRIRPAEPPDPRIAVLTIDDQDISKLGTWPPSDRVLARLLTQLQKEQPRLVGLDVYRDLVVEPGHQELVKVFQSMPNLIGVEKRFGSRRVPPPPTLKAEDRVGIVDLVEDADGRVRRNLISAQEGQTIYLALSTRLALSYLEKEGIVLEVLPQAPTQYRLGKARFTAFQSNDGGYIRGDAQGYQTLFNFRGTPDRFITVSLRDLLDGKAPKNWARDRIVLVGLTAESANDFFFTPYASELGDRFARMPGIFIHANSVSQMLSAAIEGRQGLQVLPDPAEWLWALGWALLGMAFGCTISQTSWSGKSFYAQATLGIGVMGGGVGAIGYGLFLAGWWLPCVPAVLALAGSIGFCMLFHEQDMHQLAFRDGLTQVANRRMFERKLAQQIGRSGSLSLILCDIDFFKGYNDTYGHQAGDHCLVQVAQALQQATRKSDLVARYGGEEFVVILPKTTSETARLVADRILNQVRALELPHSQSSICNWVTLSCGVSSLGNESASISPSEQARLLIQQADQALYQSKMEGRNRSTVRVLE
jgi:adenylate cyclase